MNMTSNLICRVCLCTNKLMRELTEKLSNHFEDLCDYNIDVTKVLKVMCCSTCENSLKNNLDFKSKCCEANHIFQRWKESKEKISIKSLHKQLETSTDAKQQGHIEQTHVKQTHVKQTHVKQTHVKQTHVEQTHVEQTHVEQTHVEQTHVEQTHIEQTHVEQIHTLKHKHENESNIDTDIKDIINLTDDSEIKNTPTDYKNNDESFKYEVNLILCDDEAQSDNDISDHNKHKNDTVKDKKDNIMEEDYLKYEYIYDSDNISVCEGKKSIGDDISMPLSPKGISNLDKKCLDDDDISKHANKSICDKSISKYPVTKSVKTRKKYARNKKKTSKKAAVPTTTPADDRYMKYASIFTYRELNTEREIREVMAQRRVSLSHQSWQYKCEICCMVLLSKGVLELHMKWHDPARAFECVYCHMRFTTARVLRQHHERTHRDLFTCRNCDYSTCYLQMILKHSKKHDPGKVYMCKCKMTFKNMRRLESHKRSAHAHVCVTCGRPFGTAHGLLAHRRLKHLAKPLLDSECATSTRCEPCALTFASEHAYNVHVLNTDSHADIAKQLKACSVCGLSFKDSVQVKEHYRLSHLRPPKKKQNPNAKEKPGDVVECKLCGHSGSNNSWLYQHYRTAHPAARYEATSDREFLCDQCGKGFYNKTLLKEHMYLHSGLKPYRCEKCPAAFRTKAYLKLHEERHGPPSRKCPLCGKKFANPANLSSHIRGHGARRYKCDVCAKGFVQFSSLREHIHGVHLQIRTPRTRRHKVNDHKTNDDVAN